MNIVNKIRGLFFSTLILCSGAANATLIDFDEYVTSFTEFNFRNFENVIGDIDLRIEAAIFSNSSSVITNITSGSSDDRRFGVLDNDGLGVTGYLDNDSNLNIDGNGSNDLLIFTFSEVVTFTGINFGNTDSNDDFEFGFVNGNVFERIISDERIVNDSVKLSDISTTIFTGTTFAIGAVGGNDNFRVTSITAVPEPSTLSIFALALVGFGLRLRRNK